MELKDISTAFPGEVWSDLVEMVEPMERQKQLIPDESELDAMRKIAPTKRGRLTYDWADRLPAHPLPRWSKTGNRNCSL